MPTTPRTNRFHGQHVAVLYTRYADGACSAGLLRAFGSVESAQAFAQIRMVLTGEWLDGDADCIEAETAEPGMIAVIQRMRVWD